MVLVFIQLSACPAYDIIVRNKILKIPGILKILILAKKVALFPLAPALKGGGKKNSSISHQNLRFASFREGANKTEILLYNFLLAPTQYLLHTLNF